MGLEDFNPEKFPDLAAAIERLCAYGKEAAFAAGSVICDRSVEPHLGVILSGEVEVRLISADGLTLKLSRMGPGCTFGEVSSVQGARGSSVVVALTDVKAVLIPRNELTQALKESPEINSYLLHRLAANVQEVRNEAWNSFRRFQAFNLLSQPRPAGQVAASSAYMRKLLQEIEAHAASPKTLLIRGEPGTGKFFWAAKIHEARKSPAAPLIAVDACEIKDRGRKVLFGSKVAGKTGRESPFGAVHLAHGGILLLRHVEALSAPCQSVLLAFLRDRENEPGQFPVTRLIATSSKDLGRLAEAGNFNPELSKLLLANVLTMPAMEERRKDILPLANLFLRETGTDKRLSLEAGQVLYHQHFRQRNAWELREAINLAVLFCESDEIEPKHLLAKQNDESGGWESELTRLNFVRNFLSGPSLNMIRWGTLGCFLVAIAAGFFVEGGQGELGTGASALVWSVWEPLLILSFLIAGRLWCSICPLSTAASAIQRLFRMNREHPDWLRRFGGAISLLGLLGILWAENAFDLMHWPARTSVLLMILMGCAVAAAVIFRREAWCRYLCPLGSFGATFAPGSALQLRATPSLCTSYCSSHVCVHGSEQGGGCPVFHHPLQTRSGHDCKLCFKCLKTCPHDSVKVYLRAPLQSLWKAGVLSEILVPFAVALFCFSVVQMAAYSREFIWIGRPAQLGILAVLCAVIGLFARGVLARAFAKEHAADSSVTTRIVLALLVLAWGPLMAFQLAHVPLFSDFRVYAISGTALAHLFFGKELSLVGMAQLPIVVFAGCACWLSLYRIHRRMNQLKVPRNRLAWWALGGIAILYFTAALAIARQHLF